MTKAGTRTPTEAERVVAYCRRMGRFQRDGEPRTFRGLARGARVTEAELIRVLQVHDTDFFNGIRWRQRRVLRKWAAQRVAKRAARKESQQ